MRKLWLSVISLILSTVVLIGCCSCSAGDIRSRMEIENQEISAQEIIRLTVAAINDKNKVADSYAAIPEKQRQNVSFSYFNEYVGIIRSAVKGRGGVTSFTILNEDKSNEVITEYLELAGLNGYSVYTYGVLSVAQLEFGTQNDVPFYLFVSQNTEGVYYLSYSWISGVISLYNYSEHYLSMLDDENINGIYTLISPSFSGPVYTDDVIYARAQRISDYYKLEVRSNRSAYKYSTLNPFALVVTIPETVDLITGTVSEHSFVVATNPYNGLDITDEIAVSVDTNIIYVYKNDEELARVGSKYSEDQILNLFGAPLYVTESADGRVIYNYFGLVLSFRQTNNEDLKLVSARIYSSSDYSIGGSLLYGMPLQDLLVLYPFLECGEDDNYHLTYNGVSPDVDISISVNSDTLKVESIRASI